MRSALAAVLALFLSMPAWTGDDDVADFTLSDADGRKWTLSGHKGVVVLVWMGVECPMVTRYAPRLADLSKKFPDAAFAGVNSNALETPEAIARHAKDLSLPFPVLVDADAKVAEALKVTMTPTAIVIDAARKVRYRGLIDDHKSEDLVKKRYLRDAIEAALAGKDAPVAETEPAGCAVRRTVEEKSSEVTYASHVAAILNDRCVTCHRPGQVAPFSLIGYEQSRRWARENVRHAKAGNMPPWRPVNHGTFRDERVLTADEIAILATWADAGAPRGDAAKEPAPPKFPEGWTLGEPDLVLEAPEHELGPDGADEYRCMVLPTNLAEDRWISAVEMRPGNYRIVHHIIGYVDTSGMAEKLDAQDARPGYRSNGTGPGFIPAGEMSGWAPGNFPYALPDGVGRLLKKGARIVLEMHYHRNGRAEKDRTRIGLHFAKKPVKQRLQWLEMVNFQFRLKAGNEAQRVTARHTVRADITARSVTPHMHLLGRTAKLEATFPDGTKKTLIEIAAWDFNWQDTYHFKEPLKLPKGTKLLYEAVYDNSEKNPNNPRNPPRDVTWGEETTDEMCIAFLSYTRDGESIGDEEK